MTGTFEGAGQLQFSPDNKKAFIFSGMVGVVDAEKTMFEFTTGSEYLDMNILVGSASASSDDYIWKLYYNNILVMSHYYTTTHLDTNQVNPERYIVPPFTTIKTTMENNTSSSERNWFNSMAADVAGAIQQVDLESVSDGSQWA